MSPHCIDSQQTTTPTRTFLSAYGFMGGAGTVWIETAPFCLFCKSEMASQDTSEYEALIQSYASLIACVKQSPNDIIGRLKSSGKLTPEVLSFLSNEKHDDDEKKARKILDAILDQVRKEPQVFHIFVSAMKAAGSWTEPAINVLESNYTVLQLAACRCMEDRPCETSSLRDSSSTAQAQVVPIRSSSVGSQPSQLHCGE